MYGIAKMTDGSLKKRQTVVSKKDNLNIIKMVK